MQQADFIHLVRESEIACAQDKTAYQRSVMRFVALGYAWVLGFLLLALAMMGWAAWRMWADGYIRFMPMFVLISACGLLWVSLRALWSDESAMEGVPLSPQDAPGLFEALERIRQKIKGPRIDVVYLDAEFNASIQQRPRFGLLGGSTNTLTIGLPLLMALDKARLMAVLAHEYGHLRGDHGRFSAWIYHTRKAWFKLHHSMRGDTGPFALATRAFVNWYFPRFAAKTFALARQDEYEADAAAGRLLGKDVAAAALTEVNLKAVWLNDDFWPRHWRTAAQHALPQGPFTSMQLALRLRLEPDFAQQALRQTLSQVSDVSDTHPVLRDRVEALLGTRPTMPEWSTRGALGLLAHNGAQWIKHFDTQWAKHNATIWKQHHARLTRWQSRIQTLQAQQAYQSTAEMLELANLMRSLDPQAGTRPLYEAILQHEPAHEDALVALAATLSPREGALRQSLLDQLWHTNGQRRRFAADAMVELLEAQAKQEGYNAQALRLWRDRAREMQKLDAQMRQELFDTAPFEHIARHDLSEFQLADLEAELALIRPVQEAWLLRKHLQTRPGTRAYMLIVSMPGMGDDAREQLSQSILQRIDLPGPFVLQHANMQDEDIAREVRRHAKEPFYTAAYR